MGGRDRGGVAVATGFASYRCRTTVAIDARTLSLPLAFAAGAVRAALADTLMPEAYERDGPNVALSTAAAFLLSFVLSVL